MPIRERTATFVVFAAQETRALQSKRMKPLISYCAALQYRRPHKIYSASGQIADGDLAMMYRAVAPEIGPSATGRLATINGGSLGTRVDQHTSAPTEYDWLGRVDRPNTSSPADLDEMSLKSCGAS